MQTLSSKAVAEMLGKRHDNFMRNLKSYAATLGESAPEYFIESTYTDGKGRVRASYDITPKGCDLIAGRIIGAKSAEFRDQCKEALGSVTERATFAEVHGYSIDDVAQKLGCSERTVRRMIQRGELTTTQITVMIPTLKTVVEPEVLDEYMKRRDQV